jgi:trigger factor
MEDVQMEPMVFKMVVPLAPVVQLNDYGNLRVPYIEPEVDEHDVEHQLEHLRDNQAIVEPAGDVPAEQGMLATLDVESTVDGQPFINQRNATIGLFPPLDPDEDQLDFSLSLVGLKPGEDKTFELTVPDADQYGDFRGKTAQFKVHLIELKKRELPEIDDALAQTVGDYETLDALKDEIRSELLKSKKNQTDNEYNDKVINELVKLATVEYPPQMIAQEIDSLIERTEKRMKDQNMTLAEYLKALGKTEEEYREELKPTAEIRLKRGLVLNQLIRDAGLTVTDEEVEQRIQQLVDAYGERADETRKAFSSERSREAIRLDLLSSAGVARAVAIAKGEMPAKSEAVSAA